MKNRQNKSLWAVFTTLLVACIGTKIPSYDDMLQQNNAPAPQEIPENPLPTQEEKSDINQNDNQGELGSMLFSAPVLSGDRPGDFVSPPSPFFSPEETDILDLIQSISNALKVNTVPWTGYRLMASNIARSGTQNDTIHLKAEALNGQLLKELVDQEMEKARAAYQPLWDWFDAIGDRLLAVEKTATDEGPKAYLELAKKYDAFRGKMSKITSKNIEEMAGMKTRRTIAEEGLYEHVYGVPPKEKDRNVIVELREKVMDLEYERDNIIHASVREIHALHLEMIDFIIEHVLGWEPIEVPPTQITPAELSPALENDLQNQGAKSA